MNHNTPTLLLFLFMLFLTTSFSKDLCHHDDKTVLLKIKKALNNPYDIISWDPKTDCCSEWYGIECANAANNHRVTSLDISDDNDITGQIPPEVGDLPYLQTLIFRKLPNLNGPIPSTIAKLKYLRFLRLSWTKLNGPVPEFLSKLKNLESIDLSFNDLSGSIPASLSLLTKLEYIDLSRNKLKGSIPESFGTFKVVDRFYLHLSHNQLSGPIPKSLGNVDFYEIDFSRNKLEGDALMLFGPKKSAWHIDLSRNMLEFDISKVKINETLVFLDLNHNGLTGSIPAQWTISPFQTFDVSYNRLCGPIPQGGNFQKFGADVYLHNKCLCDPPLKSCKEIMIEWTELMSVM